MKLVVTTWNMGNNINQIPNLMKKALNNNDCEIFVLGLQEVPVSKIKDGTIDLTCDQIAHDNKFFPLPINKSKTERPYSISTCKGFTSSFGGFGIYLRIYYKNVNSSHIRVERFNKHCPESTKGYVAISLNVHGKVIDIINTHMPFTKKNEYIKFNSKMNLWLKTKGFTSKDRILLGDLNSRSLLTSECLEKDIPLCRNIFDENYCILSNRLNALPYTETLKRVKITQKKSCNTLQNCSIGENLSADPRQFSTIKRLLVERDFIGNPPSKCNVIGDYREAPIYFLPSYKRDVKTGKFSLKKKSHGRLPGYPDRIVYKTDRNGVALVPSKYNLIDLKGNDHLPVYATFKLKNITATKLGGSKKNRKRNSKKSRKIKKN